MSYIERTSKETVSQLLLDCEHSGLSDSQSCYTFSKAVEFQWCCEKGKNKMLKDITVSCYPPKDFDYCLGSWWLPVYVRVEVYVYCLFDQHDVNRSCHA